MTFVDACVFRNLFQFVSIDWVYKALAMCFKLIFWEEGVSSKSIKSYSKVVCFMAVKRRGGGCGGAGGGGGGGGRSLTDGPLYILGRIYSVAFAFQNHIGS